MDDDFDFDDEWSETTSTITCPNCGESIYEDADQCFSCQHYIVSDSSFSFSTPTKIVVWLLIIALLLPAFWVALKLIG